MKKVLIIATSFPPVGERNCERVIKLCKYLPENGWEPQVLTISERQMRTFDYSLNKELPKGLKIWRVEYRKIINNIIKWYMCIPDDKVFWAFRAAKKGIALCRQDKISVILSSAPSFSSHIAAYLIKRKTHCKWIADYRDLWTGNPNHKVNMGLRRKIEVFLDGLLIRNADRVITVSEEWKQFIADKFLNKDVSKIYVLPNGYDLSDFDDIKTQDRKDDRFIISYTGVIIPSYPMKELFEAIAGLDNSIKQQIRLNLFGYIHPGLKNELKKISADLGIDGIVNFRGSIPRKEALQVQKESNVLLLMYSGYGENVKGMIPSKLFDYIASARPILAILPECRAKQIIEYGKCGVVLNPNDVEGIRTRIKELYNFRNENFSAANYNWDYLKEFERRSQVKTAARILDGCARKKVLMIATDFPPNPSVGRLRTVKFAKYMPEFGWEPIVLAPSYRYFWGRDEKLLREIPTALKVCRAFFPALIEIAASLISGRRSAKTQQDLAIDRMIKKDQKVPPKAIIISLARLYNRVIDRLLLIPDGYVLWLVFAFIKALKIDRKEKVSVIYTSIPAASLVLLGYLLKITLRKKWIIDYRDLWTGDHTRVNSHPLRSKIEKLLEKTFASKADTIITTSQQKVEYLKNFLGEKASGHIFCITNGFDPDDYPIKNTKTEEKAKLTITYTGRLYKRLSAVPFLSGLSLAVKENLEMRDKIKVVFVGDIHHEERSRLNSLIAMHGLSGLIEFKGYVSYQESLKYQLNSDALLLIMGRADTADGVIPTKIFEYLGSRKPILAIVPRGAAQQLVSNLGTGITVEPEDIEGIKRAISEIYDAYCKGDISKFIAGDDKIRGFNRKNLTQDLTLILSGV